MERYYVRPHDSGGFGIFDRAVNGWHGTGGLTQAEADRAAGKLELIHQRNMDARPKAASRVVDPPQRVRARVTLTVDAVLHQWVRHGDGWMGEVELKPDRRIWVKADDLEQA